MQKYRVTATMYTELEIIVEASSKEKAFELADEDAGLFEEIPNSGSWRTHEAHLYSGDKAATIIEEEDE